MNIYINTTDPRPHLLGSKFLSVQWELPQIVPIIAIISASAVTEHLASPLLSGSEHFLKKCLSIVDGLAWQQLIYINLI